MKKTGYLALGLLAAGVANAVVHDIGTVATVTFNSGDTLTNTGGITDWDNTTLVFNEGSDFSNVDFTALGLTSWTASFTTSTVTTWDGANLSGLALTLTGNNNFFNDSFAGTNFSGATITAAGNQPFVSSSGTLDLTNVNFSGTTFVTTGGGTLGFAGYGTTIIAGADFSNTVWIDTSSSNDKVFQDGPGSTSIATKDDAADFSGADFSGVTGANAMGHIIDNLGLFDAGTPIGAKYDSNTVLPVGFTTADLDTAGWQDLDAAPAGDPNYWTGTGGATWDQATTVNFTTSNEADPLVQDTFANAIAVSERATFADEYFNSSVATGVTVSSITIAAGGVSTGNVDFSANSVVYDVASSDINGIAGSTGINLFGTAAVTLTGEHATTGNTTIAAGSTLNLGDGVTDASLADSAIGVNGALVYNVLGTEYLDETLSGSGTIEKLGAGTLIVTSDSSFDGTTTVTAGTLSFELVDPGSASFEIASGATVELYHDVNLNQSGATFSGAGTLLKTGFGGSIWSPGAAVFALDSGALIDVQEGIFRGGNNDNEDWTSNLADLHVEEFAEFQGWEANVRVDALTGGGTVMTGHVKPDTSYDDFTLGVDNGTGIFDGVIIDNNATRFGNLVKEGSGTQTLNGDNTYTGTTTVEGGSLILNGSNASVRDTTVVAGNLTVGTLGSVSFAPTTNGLTNSIAGTVGTGTVNMNGGIYIDLSNSELLTGNSWTLVDPANLTSVSYHATDFYIDSTAGLFNFDGGGLWSFGTDWTFDESTGVLSYVGLGLTGFADWLTNYPGLTDTSTGGDEEFDGVANLNEYVFDGDPTVSDIDNPNLPTADTSGANFVFTFTRRVESTTDTTQTFQYGSDLSGWTDIVVNTDAASEVAIAAAVGDVETVTVTVLKSAFPDPDNGFGRLNVTQP